MLTALLRALPRSAAIETCMAVNAHSIEDAARRARDSIQQLNKTAMTPTRGARAELR